MSTRRQFLKRSAVVSLSPWIPAFLPRTLSAAPLKNEDRILVVVQLDGGNDGLNTVIPFADDLYGTYRNELRIPRNEILKLNDSIGLHPSLKSLSKLFEDGQLSIVQGVGYPNPNRSHFESMAIWHHARREEHRHDGIGWLGRAADLAQTVPAATSGSVYVGSEAVPVALRGRRTQAISLANESELALAPGLAAPQTAGASGDLAAFVQKTVDDSFQAARQFGEQNKPAGAGARYPDSKLGRKLQLVSRLIKLAGGTRLFYVSHPGYDTHSIQADTHERLLGDFSAGVAAFFNDLKAAALADRVVLLAFSEFGRRVQENGSAGTDHGAAGPVFLAGTSLRGGIIGAHPSLGDLDEGDLKMSVDFRQVYATVLTNWLGIDSHLVLGTDFKKLDLMTAPRTL